MCVFTHTNILIYTFMLKDIYTHVYIFSNIC